MTTGRQVTWIVVAVWLLGWIAFAVGFVRDELARRERDPDERRSFFPWGRVFFPGFFFWWLYLFYRWRDRKRRS